MTSKPKDDAPEKALREGGAARLDRGEQHPLEGDRLDEEDLRLFYDDAGNLKYIGGIDDDFRIQHDVEHIVDGVDSVDLGFLEEALNAAPIKKWLKPLEERSRFFKEAFENFFLLLVKANPDFQKRVTPKQYYLLRLLEEVVTSDEFEVLTKKCTLNLNRATMVARAWVDAIAKILDEEDLKMIEEMEWLDREFRGVFDDMNQFIQRSSCAQPVPGELDASGKPCEPAEGGEEGEPCPGCGKTHTKLRPKTAKELGLTAEEARERARSLTEQFGKLRKRIQEKIAANKDRIESLSKTFSDQASSEGKRVNDQLDSFASSFGTSEGELKQMDMEDVINTCERYKNDAQVKGVVDQLGRMRKIARKSMRSMTRDVENVKNEPREVGNDLPKMLPTEMINLRHPGKKKDFKKRYLEKEIEQYKTKGQEPVGRGPIIVCKDTSGSMSGPPNHWASAFYLAVESIAAKQRRRSVLINFSSPGQIRVAEFDRKASFVDYIDEAAYMFNGGTCFETPLTKSLEFIEKSAYKKADILFISDGVCSLSDEFLKKFNKVKAEKEFKVITILINVTWGDPETCKEFSDKLIMITDLQQDQDVLETAFAL